MTDQPRFEPAKGPPEEAHRHYNGACLVELLLQLVDWMAGRRGGGLVRSAPAHDPAGAPIPHKFM
jgi:hypothetical protein